MISNCFRMKSIRIVLIGFSMLLCSCTQAIFSFDCDDKAVALTIDDAPDGASTIELLEILSKHEVTATFFITGAYARTFPDVVKMLHEQGHELGNHGFGEKALTAIESTQLATEIQQTHDIITEYHNPSWFRPPKGRYNREVIEAIDRYHYKMVLGWLYPFDHMISNSNAHINFIKTFVRKGSIIILHDAGIEGGRGYRSAKTLDRVLPWLKEHNYKIGSLSDVEFYCAKTSND